jgi:hypothetical protein
MKEIVLGNGGIALVDDEDFDRVKGLTWYRSHYGYVVADIYVDGEKKSFSMHRMILGVSSDRLVNFKDKNLLNNTKENLRPYNHRQKNMNRCKNKNSSSRFKGVCWFSRKGKWFAQIKMYGKNKNLGFFTEEVEAARAYNHAARNLFGEFARLNPI